ncbi:MAG: transcriptional regulator [Candidatus Omnitrophica bacterium]|nr:transcriptional regulator [Candidatus Omnitrophota bacterium]
MLRNKNSHSKVMDMVEEDLHAINKIKDTSESIRKFNKIRYLPPKHFTKNDIVKIRSNLHVSQAVFAFLLNASESTVKKWELGAKEPGGANARLLQIIEKRGVEILKV